MSGCGYGDDVTPDPTDSRHPVNKGMNRHALHSYSSPVAIGHKMLEPFEERPGLLEVPVQIEEKIDGSQFSFGLICGVIRMKSRRAEVYAEAAGMFQKAVDTVLSIEKNLVEGFVYRCEYLAKPKHNTLEYGRVPFRNLILFDVETAPGHFFSPEDRTNEANRLGIEAVPLLGRGMIQSREEFEGYLDRESCLGGPKVEGIVVKPIGYNLFGIDKKVLMGKYVSEDFKEKHGKEWKVSNPGKKDIVQSIVEDLRTEARWNKAVQHLEEAGELEGSPRDIGKLFKEVPRDIMEECSLEIRDALFKHFWPQISRGVGAGLAEFYKDKLLAKAFETKSE